MVDADYTLRPATAADRAFLYRVVSETMRPHVEAIWGWDERFQRDRFEAQYDPTRWQVVLVDGSPAGGLSVYQRPDEVFLSNIHLLPEYQGRGIGRHVVAGLRDRAHAQGKPLTLSILKTNTRARQLYESLGFQVTGQADPKIWMAAYPGRRNEATMAEIDSPFEPQPPPDDEVLRAVTAPPAEARPLPPHWPEAAPPSPPAAPEPAPPASAPAADQSARLRALERRLAEAETELRELNELRRRVTALEARAASAPAGTGSAPASEVTAPFRVLDERGKPLLQVDLGRLGPRVRLFSPEGEPVAVFYTSGDTGAVQLYRGEKRTVRLTGGPTGGELTLYDAEGRETTPGAAPRPPREGTV